jgi:predicted P-loop ATPase/GTPase
MEPKGSTISFFPDLILLATRILIIGMNPFDSGKTHLAAQAVNHLHNSGLKVEYFKPLSGHNYWTHYQHTKHCLDIGILISKDAVLLRTQYESNIPAEIMNPIHSLFVPAKLDRPVSSVPCTLALHGWDSVLAMQRFSRPDGETVSSTVLTANELIEAGQLIIDTHEASILAQNAMVEPITSIQHVQAFEEAVFEGVISDSFEYVEKSTDLVLLESFNDSVWPWNGLDRVDVALVVGPGHVFVYDPERIQKAASLVKYSQMPIRDVSFRRINDLVKPLSRLVLKPGSKIDADKLELLGVL